MFEFLIKCNLYILLPLLLAGGCMSFFCMNSEAKIRRMWGWGGIVATGVIGTPIHECSHLLMALLFGYKITDVKLFCPISGKTTGILGYVKYKYRKNLFCKIGNFFVGIAPMIGGSLVIWLLFYLLFPDTVIWIKNIVNVDTAMFGNVWIQNTGGLIKTFSGHAVRLVVFCLLVIAISLHMSISKADLKGAAYGVVFLEMIVMLLSFLQYCFGWAFVESALQMIISFFWLSLSTGLIASGMTFLMISIMACWS